jgi:hypothetical protein
MLREAIAAAEQKEVGTVSPGGLARRAIAELGRRDSAFKRYNQ